MTSPEISQWANANSQQLHKALREQSRALAVSFPDAAIQQAKSFQDVLQNEAIESRIFAAHKATDRTHTIARLVQEAQCGVDVASVGELESCIRCGILPGNLIATGPKSQQLLARATEVHVCAIVLDSLNELERLLQINAVLFPGVLLRLSRSMLNRPSVTRGSRFGFDAPNYEKALMILQNHPEVPLLGLAFHLDTKSIDEKTYAANHALDLLVELPEKGFSQAVVLDAGGGFGTSFGMTESQLNQFDADFKTALQGGSLDTYQSMSYGLKKLPDGRITGDFTNIDVPAFPVGAERLKMMLAADNFAAKVSDYLVELWCEPGSALFAESGVVVSEIIDVTDRDGRMDVVPNVNNGQVLFDKNEVLIDPIFVPVKTTESRPCKGYLFGTLCMESDVLSHRPVTFLQWPQPGDLLIWPATGAYRMHMSETNAIMHPKLARYIYENNQLTEEEE